MYHSCQQLRARTALRARRRPPPRGTPRPLPPKHVGTFTLPQYLPAVPRGRRPEPSGHDRDRAAAARARASPSPDPQLPSVSRVATDSSATTRTLARGRVRRDRLGLLHFGKRAEHWHNRAPPTRCGRSEGQVAGMRVTTFVLPLAAQALVAPRPHMKRLSHQRQAAVRRPRRNPSRCLHCRRRRRRRREAALTQNAETRAGARGLLPAFT